MRDTHKKDLWLNDPLTEVTRKERRGFLLVSTIGVTITQMNIVPTEISALGLKFTETNQQSFLLVAALIVTYYLVVFSIYAWSDYTAWSRAKIRRHRDSQLDRLEKTEGMREDAINQRKEIIENSKRIDKKHLANSFRIGPFRSFIEFVLPIIIGVFSVVSLLKGYMCNA